MARMAARAAHGATEWDFARTAAGAAAIAARWRRLIPARHEPAAPAPDRIIGGPGPQHGVIEVDARLMIGLMSLR